MKDLNSDGPEESQHDNSPPSSSKPKQDDQLNLTLSELKLEFEKMSCDPSLLREVKQVNNSQRCHCQSCPCGSELGFTNYVSSNKNSQGHRIVSGNRLSDSLNIFYRKQSLYNIPVDMKSSGLSSQSKKSRRSRSVSNVGNFVVECSPLATSGDVIVSPSGRWIFGLIEENIKARVNLKSSLLFQFGVLDIKGSKLLKTSELYSPSSVIRKLAPRLVTSSLSPRVTSSSANDSSKGLLHCVRKNGLPHFVFSSDDDAGFVHLATGQKVESSSNEALDYVYSFRSRNIRENSSKASDGVGKMKVLSSLALTSSMCKLRETEFVLFGSHDDYSKRMQSSCPLTKSKGLSKKVTEIFRPSNRLKHKAIHKVGDPNFDELMRELKDSNELDNVKQFAEDFLPYLELATIVVKDYQKNSKKESSTGGWGLKFLEKIQVDDADSSHLEGNSTRNCGKPGRHVDVLIPAGYHGAPIDGNGGPSSLSERRKAGGCCDCGGWDLGCPITVLNNISLSLEMMLQDESEDDFKPVNLFFEGKQNCEPMLRMEHKSKDLYHIYFHHSLSALQSFSIAVAILHAQTPDFYPTLL